MSARIVLIILFIIIMAGLWLPYFYMPKKAAPKVDEIANVPDYIAIDLKQTNFDQSGRISHQVKASKMSMYQELGFTHFEQPQFTIFSDEGVWQLSAAEATLYDGDKLILEQDVTAQNLTPNAMLNLIQAASIEYLISTKLMTSKTAVTMTGPGLTITGQGLDANLDSEVIKLINHTKTSYYDK